MRKLLNGFTLVEIIIATVVVGVVASVTLQITKQKTENLVRYYYYSAYSLLQAAVDEVIASEGVIETPCVKLEEKLNNISSNCATYTATNFGEGNTQMILRTGARVYVSGPAGLIVELNDIPASTVYVDIDGEKGDGILWSDVFPFYITVPGKVIPTYPQSDDLALGAKSTRHLAVSVKYDVFNSGVRQSRPGWLARGVSFQEAACKSGYVTGSYCGTISTSPECTNDANCRIVPIRPGLTF